MILKLFVPGRLCLFGEHTDWAGKYRSMNADIVPGMSIVTGIEQGIYAEVEKSTIFEMHSDAPEIADVWRDFSCQMEEQELKGVARSGSFFSYCAGVASYMLEWYKVGGVKITLKSMTLPMKSGLSSSAAICVLVARAFNQLYHLSLNTMGEMNIAYLGELRTSSRCGRLDQACAFGVKPNLMTFDGEEVEVRPLKLSKPLYWVFADLCAQKDTIKILRDLNKAYPFASNEMEKREQRALGELNHNIINRAIEYIEKGSAEQLGKLMVEAQQLFDFNVAPLCPEELTSPKLHETLNDPIIQRMTFGGKGVGSQGDGSVQFLAKDQENQSKLIQYLNVRGMKAYALTLQPEIRSGKFSQNVGIDEKGKINLGYNYSNKGIKTMKRILVTGGAGFIGSHLCERLVNEGHDVICLDNFYTGSKENVWHLLGRPNFEIVRHDVCQPYWAEVDEIYNLACPASPIHYQHDPIQTTKTSVFGAYYMLGLARRTKCKILQASTSEVYGDPAVHPQPEDYWGNVNPIGIRSCYDEGKRCAETMFFDYHRQHDVRIKVIRIFNTYGPRMAQHDGRVVSNFIMQALRGEDITIYGDGKQTRSFQYVSDLVEGMIRMMESGDDLIGPVNIGNPGEFTMLELAEKVIELTGAKSKIIFQPLPLDDPKMRRPDISLAKERLDWEPKVMLDDGLKKTIDYFKNSNR